MLKLVRRSSTPVLSLEDAVQHLRRDDVYDDDYLIERMVKAATLWAENFTGLALVDQTWDYFLDEFPTTDRFIEIPKPPLIEIVEVYGSSTLFTDYETDYAGPSIFLDAAGSWPTTDVQRNAVRIRFRAGYVDETASPYIEEQVPEDIKAAIAIYTANLYEYRESFITGTAQTAPKLPWGAEELLRQYRVEKSLA